MNLTELMQNPYAWAILSVCTIAAFIFAIYTWFVGKKKKEISYVYSTYEIIKMGNSVIPGVQLLYHGKDIADLTITRYAIWNSGNEVLNSTDIVATKQLSIICTNDTNKILDAEIVKKSDETNLFTVKQKNDTCIEVTFDYAAKQDGIILQVLHTGTAIDLKVDCKIKGGNDLKNLSPQSTHKKNNKSFKRSLIILTGIECVLIVITSILFLLMNLGLISQDLFLTLMLFSPKFERVFAVLLIILTGILIFMYWKLFIKAYHINIPSPLRSNIEYEP